MRTPHHILTLENVCKSLDLETENLDLYSDQLLKVSKGNESYIFGAGNICSFPINSATSTMIVKDKSHTVSILNQNNFKTTVGDYFFLNDSFSKFRRNGKELIDANSITQRLGFPLFIKPNDGSRGAFVEKIFNNSDLNLYIEKHKSHLQCVRVEKPLKGSEYRLFIVDGNIWFGYKRLQPVLICDGKSTIKELIEKESNEQSKYGNKTLTISSPYLRNQLLLMGLELGDTPNKGVELEFSPANNLSLGGEIANYSETFSVEMNSFASRLQKLFNLRVFGIDVYCEGELTPQNLSILEINGNPSIESADKLSNSNIIFKLWKYIINETFTK